MSDLSFARPEFLYAVPAAVLLILLAAVIGRKRTGSMLRRVTATVLRLAVVLLLIVAAAGPFRPFETSEARGTVVLVDRSGSVSRKGAAFADDFVSTLRKEGSTTVMPFGDERATDARGAILAAAVSPADRVLLTTDGHLDADAAELLGDLTAAGRRTGLRAIQSESGEQAVQGIGVPVITVPNTLREGAPVEIRVALADADEVTISIDGETVGTTGFIDGVARIGGVSMAAGPHEITAVARGPGGGAAAAELVTVEGPLRVLVLGSTMDGPVPRALAAQGMAVAAVDSEGPDVPDLSEARVVITLARFALPPGGEPLAAFVKAGGGLLAATGAPRGLSRYENAPVADLLPAAAMPAPPEVTPPPPPEEDPPEEKPPEEGASPAEVDKDALTITVLLVIDRSGSMRGGKMAVAKAACLAAAQTLDPQDRIGVLAFNEEFHWIQRPAAAGDLVGLKRALARLTPDGGTEIYVALREAYEGIREEKSGIKHVILVSDGQDLLAGFRKLISAMVAERITLSTVGIGQDYEPRLLGALARWGRGRFYPANDPRELPRVVTLDTQRVIEAERPPDTKPSPDVTAGTSEPDPTEAEEPEQPTVADPVAVTAATPLPFLEGLTFPELPEIEPVEPRFPAQTALVAADGSPALTIWRFGEGRVAHFAGELIAWQNWEDYPRFLAQICRQLAGTAEDEQVPGPEVTIVGRRVVAETPEPPRAGTAMIDEEETPLSFRRTGPGRYEAPLPAVPAGTLIRASVTGADGVVAGAVAVADRTREELATGLDEPAIRALTATASKTGSGLPGAPPDRRHPGEEPVHLPLLFVALGLLPLDVAVRRIGR